MTCSLCSTHTHTPFDTRSESGGHQMQGKGGGRGAGFGLNMPMSTMNPQHVLAAHVGMGFQNTMLPQGQQPQPQQPPQPQPQHTGHHMMAHHVGQPQHHSMHAQPFTRNIQANFGSSLGPAHVVPRIPHANIPQQQQQQQQQGLAHRIPASSRHPAAVAAAAASGYPVPAKVVPVAQVKAKVQPADAAAAAAAAATGTPGAATLVPQTKAASPQSVQNGAGAAGGELLVAAQAGGGGGGGAATAAAAAEMMFDMVDFQEMDAQSTQPVTRASAFHPSLPLLVSGDGDGVLYLTRPQPVGGTPSSVGTLQCAGAVSDILCTEECIYVAASTVRVYSAKEVHEAFAAKEEEAAAAKAGNGAEEAAEEEKKKTGGKGKKEAAEADGEPALGRLLLDVLPVVSAALPDNNQIPVTLCGHGDDLVVGDSNGRVWRYRFVPKQQGTGDEEQGASLTVCDEPYSLHRTNVTGIAFDDTRMITSSQDGTVLLSSIKVPIPRTQTHPPPPLPHTHTHTARRR